MNNLDKDLANIQDAMNKLVEAFLKVHKWYA